jgi:spermidine synthase
MSRPSPQKPSGYRSPIHLLLLYFLFFLSGFSALVYEVVWSRMLVLVMGNTVFAASTILSVFMAGLSLGGLYWGNNVDRTGKNPLVLFGRLETGTGIAALAVSWIIWQVVPLGAWISPTSGSGNFLQILIRFLICFCLLFVPTFLIGGTLAAIGKHIISDTKFFARKTAGLYGINTAGSFFGAFLTGFFLIKALGNNGSILTAASLNCLSGVVAILLSKSINADSKTASEPIKREKRRGKVKTAKPDVKTVKSNAKTANFILLGLMISGFCSIAYQILWTRILLLLIDNSVYSFTIILMAFLAGIALGSMIFNRITRLIASPVLVFAMVEICIGVTAFLFPYSVHLKSRIGPDVYYYNFLLSTFPWIILVPTIFMGMAFPLGAQIYQRHKKQIGRSLGNVYFINTAGCVLGGISTGFFLIGHLGFRKSIFILTGLNVVIGVVIGIWSQKGKIRYAFLIILIMLPFLGLKAMPGDYFKKKYSSIEPQSKLIYYKESASTTATLFEHPDKGLSLYLNGIPEVNTSYLSIKTFKLMGALPGLLERQKADNALMITFGAGVSAGTAVLFTRHLDCVDIASQASDIAPFFDYYNNNIIKNPNISLYNDDARHFLEAVGKQYSIITSDASHPRIYDSWVLFTSEFYKLVKRHLTKDGIFLQWLPYHGMTTNQYLGIVRTFNKVFPHTSLWTVGEGYSLLVAMPEPLKIDFQGFLKKIMTTEIKDNLRMVGLDNPFEILSYFTMAEKNVREMVSGSSLIMSDNAPAHLFFPISSTFKDQYTLWPLANYQKVREYRESVVPYLFNLSDSEVKKGQIINVLRYYEHSARP